MLYDRAAVVRSHLGHRRSGIPFRRRHGPMDPRVFCRNRGRGIARLERPDRGILHAGREPRSGQTRLGSFSVHARRPLAVRSGARHRHGTIDEKRRDHGRIRMGLADVRPAATVRGRLPRRTRPHRGPSPAGTAHAPRACSVNQSSPCRPPDRPFHPTPAGAAGRGAGGRRWGWGGHGRAAPRRSCQRGDARQRGEPAAGVAGPRDCLAC